MKEHEELNQFECLRADLSKQLSKDKLLDIMVHYSQCDSTIFYDLCIWTEQGSEAIEAAQTELPIFQACMR
ncbi:hypothetical protein AGMMS49992_31360 [Clostridia bacterium]|nr:hypothetical protein AGMMS49992_31360 [Clostridia bacterium]